MENSLLELWSLFNFVQPGILGDSTYFEREFCRAIIKGGYTDADPVEQEAAKLMIAELRKRMKQHFLRRTKKMLKEQCKLPQRNEFIVPITMTQCQLNVYEQFLRIARTEFESIKNQVEKSVSCNESFKNNLGFVIINNLRKICNHPFLFFDFI